MADGLKDYSVFSQKNCKSDQFLFRTWSGNIFEVKLSSGDINIYISPARTVGHIWNGILNNSFSLSFRWFGYIFFTISYVYVQTEVKGIW